MTTQPDAETLRGSPELRASYASQFLELFYPVHYRIGIGIEDAMRRDSLTRHQVAVLWLMRTEGKPMGELRRKHVEIRLGQWFELQNSAVSKVLRSLTKPPLELIEIFEDPESGREKRVRLTAAGEAEMDAITAGGQRFIEAMVDHLTQDDSEEGVRFLAKVSEIVELLHSRTGT